MKKKIATGFVSALLLTGSFALSETSVEARSIQEMQSEKNTLQKQFGTLTGDIENRQKNMNELQEQQAQLEEEVQALQGNIDQLTSDIQIQEDVLQELEAEIETLQAEIDYLKEQIALREEKMDTQARAIQTQGNATNMVTLVMEADSFSDLVGRLSVVTQLLGANKDIVQAQADDQQMLEEKETQVQADKEAAEAVKAELELNQTNLLAQKQQLDDKIIQVAELFELNATEKETFLKEQQLLAEKTSALTSEINAEQAKVAAAKRAAAQTESLTSSNPPKKNAAGFVRPANGPITSSYGYRIHPIHKTKKLHAGTDITGGGAIVAAQSGTVVTAGYNSGFGYYVKINHGGGVQTIYAHMLPNLNVSVGQHVSQGQQIGTMGSTGTSTGVHLHFEVHINGSTVDPAQYL